MEPRPGRGARLNPSAPFPHAPHPAGAHRAGLILNNVVKRNGNGNTVIKGLDLEIRDHEFMVLVGPSGCGKSTGLRMVAGLESSSAGTISIGGKVVNELPSQGRDVAMVFQNYAPTRT